MISPLNRTSKSRAHSPRTLLRILPLTCLATGIMASSPQFGEQSSSGNRLEDAWTVNLYLENDVIADTDQNYTNGFKVSWISPDISHFREVPKTAFLQGLVDRLPYINKPGLQRNVVLSLGQNMYTPQEIWHTDFIAEDRPYGGWLYLGFGFNSKTAWTLDSWEINLGIVGPYSWAADTQKLVHELIDSPRPVGWHHQIDTEPGVNLVYLHKKRFFQFGEQDGWKIEAFRHYGGSVGNVATYLNAGVETRAGWNLPTDFGSALIRMAEESGSPTTPEDPRFASGAKSLGFSLHAALDARFVARDIFLDGNTFKDSHSVEKINEVGDLTLGASLTSGSWKLSYTQVFRSRQYELQDKGHTFGSAAISFVY